MTACASKKSRAGKAGVVICLLLMNMSCSSSSTVEHQTLLRIQTSQDAYNSGDSITISVRNVGDQAVAFFACPVYLDRTGETGWTEFAPMPGYRDDDCDLMSTPLLPGASIVLHARLPESPDGTYRLRLDGLLRQVKPVSRISNTFIIR